MRITGGIASENTRWNSVGSNSCTCGLSGRFASRLAVQVVSPMPGTTAVPFSSDPVNFPLNSPPDVPLGRVT
jgi:hypothetical protein